MHIKMNTLVSIDVMEGKVDGDFNKLTEILLDGYGYKGSSNPLSTKYEDSYCPQRSPIVDDILGKIVDDFYKFTKNKVVVDECWGHIHEKNMSTQLHSHSGSFASGVVYIRVPKGSGNIVFVPNIIDTAFSFPPERGRYYIFPGYLDHYVTRNNSDEMRVSLSFNLQRN